MAKFFKSIFSLTKRYSRFSNTCVYFSNKRVRYGYKLYQKIFRRYKSGQNFRINVRKPRMAVRRKTTFGQALEIREKFSYLLGGLHSSKLRRYCRLSRSKFFAPAQTFINLLETRLDIILYRSNLFSSPKAARSFIKSGYVYVNKRKVFNPSFKAPTNSTIDITLPNYFYAGILSSFKLSISKNLIFIPEPGNLSISYKLFRVIVDSRVDVSKVFYPFNFNINYFYRLYSILQRLRRKVESNHHQKFCRLMHYLCAIPQVASLGNQTNWLYLNLVRTLIYVFLAFYTDFIVFGRIGCFPIVFGPGRNRTAITRLSSEHSNH